MDDQNMNDGVVPAADGAGDMPATDAPAADAPEAAAEGGEMA